MDEERADEERQRPKVVDKRVSSGGHQPSRPAAPPQPPPAPEQPPSSSPPPSQASAAEEPIWTPEEEAAARQMAQEIAERPGLDWVVNSAVSLANIAATKLQIGDPADAQICIDALAGLLNGLTGRLQDAEQPLRQTLAQLQMAYTERVTGQGPHPQPPTPP